MSSSSRRGSRRSSRSVAHRVLTGGAREMTEGAGVLDIGHLGQTCDLEMDQKEGVEAEAKERERIYVHDGERMRASGGGMCDTQDMIEALIRSRQATRTSVNADEEDDDGSTNFGGCNDDDDNNDDDDDDSSAFVSPVLSRNMDCSLEAHRNPQSPVETTNCNTKDSSSSSSNGTNTKTSSTDSTPPGSARGGAYSGMCGSPCSVPAGSFHSRGQLSTSQVSSRSLQQQLRRE